jgi:subtilisin family serine protease
MKIILTCLFTILFSITAYSKPQNFIFVVNDNVEGVASHVSENWGIPVNHVYTNVIQGFTMSVPIQAATIIVENNPEIRYYEEDKEVSISVRKSGGNNNPPPEEPVEVVSYGTLRVGGPFDGTGHTAWIVDTGIDYDHPDLNINTRKSKTFVSSLFKGKQTATDNNGHGTHVAGIIGAIDNTIGTVGVAQNATLISVKVLGSSGTGYLSTILEGLDYVAAEASPGDCVNLSLSSPFSQTFNDSVISLSALGMYVTVAAGNESTDANTRSPASANDNNIYTVSSIDSTDTFASFSNWGNPPIDFAAPGVDIVSSNMGGGIRVDSGTSMAAPHVCGLLLVHGNIIPNGTAINDPDNNPDGIAN